GELRCQVSSNFPHDCYFLIMADGLSIIKTDLFVDQNRLDKKLPPFHQFLGRTYKIVEEVVEKKSPSPTIGEGDFGISDCHSIALDKESLRPLTAPGAQGGHDEFARLWAIWAHARTSSPVTSPFFSGENDLGLILARI